VNPSVSSWLPTAIFVPLVAFGLYRRVKRTFGQQPVTPRRMTFRMVLLSVVGVAFLVWTPTPLGFAAAAIGAALGSALGSYGLRHTTYEVTAAGKAFTPNPWIGMVVMALFLGRLAARLLTFYEAGGVGASAAAGGGFHRSSLTTGVFFLMAAYYVAYYAGVLAKARTLGAPS
jgi:hypothetical protein